MANCEVCGRNGCSEMFPVCSKCRVKAVDAQEARDRSRLDGTYQGPRPTSITAACGHKVQPGDRCFNFYDAQWGTIVPDSMDQRGWFSFVQDDGRTTCLNADRITKEPPAWMAAGGGR